MMSALIDHVKRSKIYNGRTMCSDFAKIGVEAALNKKIDATESIVGQYSTTPNKLFEQTRKADNATVVKDPGNLTKNSLFRWSAWN